jgi:polynucleotide 5'-hydroxyl-kinase GRC3/NOL9
MLSYLWKPCIYVLYKLSWCCAILAAQGDVSSQSEPGRYLQAVQALCSRYYSMAAAAAAAQQPPPPLVVNTPGWITGLGLELLAEALRCAGPSYG